MPAHDSYKKRGSAADGNGQSAGRRSKSISRVVSSENRRYAPGVLDHAIVDLFARLDPDVIARLRRANTVLIKPTLRHDGSTDYRGRMTSHPRLVSALIAHVAKYGCKIYLGDAGLLDRDGRFVDHGHWLHAVARDTGATAVSFAASGAQRIHGRLLVPRNYPIAKAFTDVDMVINCANAQPHARLVMAGAVKNTFNALLGSFQARLCALSLEPRHLAKCVADVHGIVRPDLSILDLTTVRRSLGDGELSTPGLLLAGEDAVAVDAVAARVLGLGDNLPVAREASALRLDTADMAKISVDGVAARAAERTQPGGHWSRPPSRETSYARASRFLNNSLLRQRNVVNENACESCGECKRICPLDAISLSADQKPRIDYRRCMDCDLCRQVCPTGAIQGKHIGVVGAARKLFNAARH